MSVVLITLGPQGEGNLICRAVTPLQRISWFRPRVNSRTGTTISWGAQGMMTSDIFPHCLEETQGKKVGGGPAGDPAEAVGSERGRQHCPEGLLAAITMVARLPKAG